MYTPKLFDIAVAALAAVSMLGAQASKPGAPGKQAQKGAAAQPTKVNPKDGLVYRWIAPGSFTIGCSPGDNDCYRDEKRNMKITLTRGFWIGETETTQGAYKKIMPRNPSRFKGDNLPAEQREVIVARLWGGLTLDEIAVMVGCSVSSAHRRFEAGIAVLRERLGESCPKT